MPAPSSSLVIIPVLANLDLSIRAIYSALNQSVDPTVLVIDQGSDPDVRAGLELASKQTQKIRLWRHFPRLPSLAATWNCALQYAWDSGHQDALVVNNDVELPREYYRQLRMRMEAEHGCLFLSGVGVNPGQSTLVGDDIVLTTKFELHPDFSAFLITRACHRKYPFDEQFIPAYCEDLDLHRRALIAGDGHRIGKINVPFIHHSSATLKSLSPEKNAKLSAQISAGSRAYYFRKWGGPVNEEKFLTPFGAHEPPDGASCTSTPDLRDRCAAGFHPCGDIQLGLDVEPAVRKPSPAALEAAAVETYSAQQPSAASPESIVAASSDEPTPL